MRSKHFWLAPLVAVGAAIAPLGVTTGCAGDSAYVAYESPPAPRYETYEYRPGYVWADGYWGREGGRWSWRGGHYERERAGHVYVRPTWEQRGNRHVFVQGGWRAHGGVTIR